MPPCTLGHWRHEPAKHPYTAKHVPGTSTCASTTSSCQAWWLQQQEQSHACGWLAGYMWLATCGRWPHVATCGWHMWLLATSGCWLHVAGYRWLATDGWLQMHTIPQAFQHLMHKRAYAWWLHEVHTCSYTVCMQRQLTSRISHERIVIALLL